jgi:hypothetical protein
VCVGIIVRGNVKGDAERQIEIRIIVILIVQKVGEKECLII